MKKAIKVILLTISVPIILFAILNIIVTIWSINYDKNNISQEEEILYSIGEDYTYINGCFIGVRDYIEYVVYEFEEPNIENAKKLKKIDDKTELVSYIDAFNDWIKPHKDKEYKSYDFDIKLIDKSDYYYIYDKSNEDDSKGKYIYYDVYFYDSQTKTIYVFHSHF